MMRGKRDKAMRAYIDTAMEVPMRWNSLLSRFECSPR